MLKFIGVIVFALVVTACENPSGPPTPTVTAGVTPGACHIRGTLPDSTCTPGTTNPNVTPSTIGSTICVDGWTKTIRPPVSYTDHLKIQQIAEYGYADTSPADYEEDHLIALSLGGHPTDPHNLWPEPRYGSPNAADKDKIENYLRAQVCAGKMPLVEAQKGIATDWTQYLEAVAVSGQGISSADPDDNGE